MSWSIYLKNWDMKSNHKKLGNFIREANERNSSLKTNTLLGVNIDKFFMPSVANIVGTDMTNYKVVRKGQFACNRMHVGRDYRLPVALAKRLDDFIVSPAYDVFEIEDEKELLSEYLMMWFSRKEFDRNAWFYTDADVRGGLPWKSLCDMQIPVPSIHKQQEIVKEFHAVTNRISLNNQLIKKLEETAQVIYKQWFVDFEFPDRTGRPYKSSGGDVNDISKTTLGNFVVHSKQSVSPGSFPEEAFLHYSIPAFDATCLPKMELGKEILSNKFIVKDNSILISKLNPSFSRVWSLYGMVKKNSVCSTEFQVLVPRNEAYFGFVFFFLKSEAAKETLVSMSTGTSNSHQRVKPDNLLGIPMMKFDDSVIDRFNAATIPFIKMIMLKRDETLNLEKIRSLLLSRMATIEN